MKSIRSYIESYQIQEEIPDDKKTMLTSFLSQERVPDRHKRPGEQGFDQDDYTRNKVIDNVSSSVYDGKGREILRKIKRYTKSENPIEQEYANHIKSHISIVNKLHNAMRRK